MPGSRAFILTIVAMAVLFLVAIYMLYEDGSVDRQSDIRSDLHVSENSSQTEGNPPDLALPYPNAADRKSNASANSLDGSLVDPVITSPPLEQVSPIERTYDTSITTFTDNDIRRLGEKVDFNPVSIFSLEAGEAFSIFLKNRNYTAVVDRNIETDFGNRYISATLSGSANVLTVYYGAKSIRGKIYSDSGAFIYESDGRETYMMSLYEYKEINDALAID